MQSLSSLNIQVQGILGRMKEDLTCSSLLGPVASLLVQVSTSLDASDFFLRRSESRARSDKRRVGEGGGKPLRHGRGPSDSELLTLVRRADDIDFQAGTGHAVSESQSRS